MWAIPRTVVFVLSWPGVCLRRRRSLLQADGKSLFDPRVTVTGGNLTLTGVRSADRGVYRCVASNIAATISVETELIVEENLLFNRRHLDLHVNSTNRHIVAYWKRPYSLCTVWLVAAVWLPCARS